VVVTAFKLAEDGDGSIVRAGRNLRQDQPRYVSDSDDFRVMQAWRANALEDSLAPITAVDGVVATSSSKPFEVATIRMKTEPLRAGK
jgi:alpha-mannosidase